MLLWRTLRLVQPPEGLLVRSRPSCWMRWVRCWVVSLGLLGLILLMLTGLRGWVKYLVRPLRRVSVRGRLIC